MKSTIEYLDEVRKIKSLTSDYQLAHFLGISDAAISRYRKNKNYMDNYTALRVAAVLEKDPMELIASCALQRAKMPEEKSAWKKLLKNLSKSATAASLMSIAILVSNNIDMHIYSILC